MERQINVSGGKQRRICPLIVAKAVGADIDPVLFKILEKAVASRLRSTGGRPRLDGAIRRTKVPLQDSDWAALEKLSQQMRDQSHLISPGQIASVLLSWILGGSPSR